MFSTPAPPQWALASHENGSSYLSWKRKTLLAVAVILCGGGLAAQFPSAITCVEPVVVSFSSSQTDMEDAIPLISQPQTRYAGNFQAAEGGGSPSFVKPAEPIGRYVEPPAMNKESNPENPPVTSQSPPLRRTRVFEAIDDSELKRTPLNLPLARWNPLFDKPPPLSERSPQPLVDDSSIVSVQPPAQPETVQMMRPSTKPFINTVIDPAPRLPAKKQEITVILREDSIVPANQNLSSGKITPMISEDQIRPLNME